jgi:hypothetical protein
MLTPLSSSIHLANPSKCLATTGKSEIRDVQVFSVEEQLKRLGNEMFSTINSKTGLKSNRCHSNLQNAVARLRGEKKRKNGRPYALQCLKKSPQIFVLIHACYAADTLDRMNKQGREELFDAVVKWWSGLTQTHTNVLSGIAEEYGVTTLAAGLTYPIASSQ